MANLCHSSLIPFKHIYGGSDFLVPLIWRSCALRFLTHSGFTGFCPMNWIAAQPSFGEEPASTNHHGSSRSFKPCKFSDCEAKAPVLRFRDRLHCAAGDALYPAPLRWSGPGPESVQLAGLETPHQSWDPSLNGISIASLNKCLVVYLLDLVWCWWNVDNILCGFNARRQEFQPLTMTKLQILLIAPCIPSARTWPQGWWMLHAAPTPVLSGTNPCFALILFVLAEHGSPKAGPEAAWSWWGSTKRTRGPPSDPANAIWCQSSWQIQSQYVAVWQYFGSWHKRFAHLVGRENCSLAIATAESSQFSRLQIIRYICASHN